MRTNTSIIRAVTEPQLKKEVEQIFKDLGISTSEAINLFYRQVQLQKGIPFTSEIQNIPNEKTTHTFEKTQIIKCKNAEDMFRKLGI